ncbi:MAG: DUF5020 family protein [Bacteroidales bacterium]|nr:DUF5020 family protein [Bacteroidales bacterium]
MKKTILSLIAVLTLSVSAFAADGDAPKTMFNGSTNIQLFYDLGVDRNYVTTTIEGFYSDPWGNTFFFVDHDFPVKGDASKSPSGTYWEIARCLNFWQNSAVKDLSVQVEYNGGVYNGFGINHAFLAGLDYFLHSSDYKNCFNFKLLYKHILYPTGNWGKVDAMGLPVVEDNHQTMVPLQFTFVWGMQDLFGAPGLRFSGFLDFWGEDHFVRPIQKFEDGTWGVNYADPGELSHFVLISEPQIWYAVGQHFGCPNLNIGGEVELAWSFGGIKNFMARPCLGLKWIF